MIVCGSDLSKAEESRIGVLQMLVVWSCKSASFSGWRRCMSRDLNEEKDKPCQRLGTETSGRENTGPRGSKHGILQDPQEVSWGRMSAQEGQT